MSFGFRSQRNAAVGFAMALARVLGSASPGAAAILITEVIPNVTTTATSGDIVELYNTGPGAVDLTDWILTDMDPDPAMGVVQDATFAPPGLAVGALAPGAFAVVDFVDQAGTASWQPTNYGLRIVAPLVAGSFLGSERDELLLVDDADVPRDFVAWADTTTTVSSDSYDDLSAVTGVVFDYGLTPGDASWVGAENVASDGDYYASAVDFTAFASVSTFGGGALRRRSTGGVFDVAAPDGAAQWEAVDRHLATLGNASDDVPSAGGLRPLRVTDDLATWLGQIETTTFPDRRLARFADQNPSDFVAATPQNQSDWEDVLQQAMDADWEDAFAAADAIGYEVVEFLDTTSGETFHLLRERFVPGDPGFRGQGTYAFFDGTGVRDDLVIEIPHPIFDSGTLEQGAEALVAVRPRLFAVAGTHRNNHTDETTCDGTFSGGDKFRISDTAHDPDNLLHTTHRWLEANTAELRTVQLHGFCCPGVAPYDALSDDCVVSNGFDAAPGPADFTQILRTRIDAQNFLADGVDLTTAAVFGDDTDVLGATTNLQGRVTNGVTVGTECTTAAVSSTGRFTHLEQDPDVREEPTHIVTALAEALDAADDVPSPCLPAPEVGCREAAPGKAKVGIGDRDGSERDRLQWKWTRGAATDLVDFADAVSGSAVYQLCLYDSSLADQPLVDAGVTSGGTCDGKPCWKAQGSKGFGYKDKAGSSEGLTALKLKAGAEGKAKVLVKAAGENLALAGLPLVPPVVVQLLIDDGMGVECWQTTFSDEPKKNDAEKFKAKQ